MEKLRGYVGVRGQLAYVPQQAWIQNLTLRDSILFGRPMQKTFYERVVDACALRPDLAILPQGDMTEIGEKVTYLSFTFCYLSLPFLYFLLPFPTFPG